jgi:hypothetical protein
VSQFVTSVDEWPLATRNVHGHALSNASNDPKVGTIMMMMLMLLMLLLLRYRCWQRLAVE